MSEERTELIRKMDDIVDHYHQGGHDIHTLIDMRRELAIWSYRLTAHIKEVHGKAGLTYLQRKHRIAEVIVDARNLDAKKPMNIMEQEAMKMPSVVAAQTEEVWAEAEKEALRGKLEFIKQVLASLQQEISVLSFEMKTTHHQGQSA